jgi:biopolymer transport protein ExbD
MSIQAQCAQCGSTHKVNDRLAGRRVRCPNCSTTIDVPEVVRMLTIRAESQEDDVLDEVEVEFVQDEPVKESNESLVPASQLAEMNDEFDDEDSVPLRRKREDEELDMTPMVDVTFLLLIFFMVTASFSLQKSIEMPRQQTDAPSTSTTDEEPEELDQVELQVDEFGSFLVLAADWERETPGKQNLITALKESLTAGSDGTRLAVKVHELAKLQALVDAMDAGTIAGFTQIEVTQVEDFD